mmetsp:Transcript_6546/g.7112  ORF Transcript_6546/g.7112 Transcript_6546/m.7112 type:complete len:223 (+) Transcript_6546:445-1113(+)
MKYNSEFMSLVSHNSGRIRRKCVKFLYQLRSNQPFIVGLAKDVFPSALAFSTTEELQVLQFIIASIERSKEIDAMLVDLYSHVTHRLESECSYNTVGESLYLFSIIDALLSNVPRWNTVILDHSKLLAALSRVVLNENLDDTPKIASLRTITHLARNFAAEVSKCVSNVLLQPMLSSEGSLWRAMASLLRYLNTNTITHNTITQIIQTHSTNNLFKTKLLLL